MSKDPFGKPTANKDTTLSLSGILSNFFMESSLNEPIQHVPNPSLVATNTMCSRAIAVS